MIYETTIFLIDGWRAHPSNARLYFEDDPKEKKIGAWCSHDPNPKYLQIDLQRKRRIAFIATQGEITLVIREHTRSYNS